MIRVWLPAAIAIALAVNVTQTAGSQVLSSVGNSQADAAEVAASSKADLELYRGAIAAADRAEAAAQKAEAVSDRNDLLNYLKRERFLWQSALDKLSDIPEDSALHKRALLRLDAYQAGLANAETKLEAVSRTFITEIVQAAGVADKAHVTLCQLHPPKAQPSEVRPLEVRPSEAQPAPEQTAEPSNEKERLPSKRPRDKRRTQNKEQPHSKTRANKKESPKEQLPAQLVGEGSEGTLATAAFLTKTGDLNAERCRQYQGEQPLASPASLIKLPIAVALLDKVKTENLDLDDPLFIDPGNFTENAAGATIETGNEYPLGKVMAQMIQESDNIATNQLIDYLGYDAMNKAMDKLGYPQTSIGHKLIGAQAAPADFGNGVNQSTTNDITAMTANIYSLHRPGDEEILRAMSNQQDWELGFEALKDLRLQAKWLGEKTGQNNLVIATTLAMEIDEARYVLTVAINDDSDIFALREIIGGVAAHLVKNGALTDQ